MSLKVHCPICEYYFSDKGDEGHCTVCHTAWDKNYCSSYIFQSKHSWNIILNEKILDFVRRSQKMAHVILNIMMTHVMVECTKLLTQMEATLIQLSKDNCITHRNSLE